MDVDTETLAAELLKALRGKRTQGGFSRWLGYRSNIAYRWEHQLCFPTAARFLAICARRGVDLPACYQTFFQRPPRGALADSPVSPEAAHAFLVEIRGRVPMAELARTTGYHRQSIARWLKGTAQPKLPEYLRLIQACTRRLLDFVAALMPVEQLPSVADEWARLQLARETAYERPWSHAVLRGLELSDYRAFGHRQPGWLAKKLGLSQEQVEGSLAMLHASGQVRKQGSRYAPRRVLTVDTRMDSVRAREVKASWLEFSLGKLRRGSPGTFGYSLFAISREDLRRIRALHLEYVSAMQTIIAASTNDECVGLYCSQLMDLSELEDNALSE